MPLPFILGGIAALASAAGTAAAAVGTAAAAAGAAAAGTAAAVGTAAAGTVAAVGTAAAGTAAAVGTAATAAGTAAAAAGTAAATAAGSALAGTAVGSTALGAMSAIGTGVGTVAAAASSAPVIGAAAGTISAMTGTAAGSAAVGTIATSAAIGAANGVSGASKLMEAKEIKEAAERKYNKKKRQFDQSREKTEEALKKLGYEKLKIWKSFERFSEMYSKIQNPPIMNGNVDVESVSISIEELNNIRSFAIGAKKLLSGGVGSIVSGNLIGLATSSGLIGTITTASTGTAISSLSGAAATNATLAALGGGALSAGGAGMAGGAMALSGLTFAPMAMVGGIMLNSAAKKAKDTAIDIEYEVDGAVEKMCEAIDELAKIHTLSNNIKSELDNLNLLHKQFMDKIEPVVESKRDYKKFSYEERGLLEKTILSLKVIKMLSMQNILDSEHENKVLTNDVNNVIEKSKDIRKNKLDSH